MKPGVTVRYVVVVFSVAVTRRGVGEGRTAIQVDLSR